MAYCHLENRATFYIHEIINKCNWSRHIFVYTIIDCWHRPTFYVKHKATSILTSNVLIFDIILR
jgi:hypothetical protein